MKEFRVKVLNVRAKRIIRLLFIEIKLKCVLNLQFEDRSLDVEYLGGIHKVFLGDTRAKQTGRIVNISVQKRKYAFEFNNFEDAITVSEFISYTNFIIDSEKRGLIRNINISGINIEFIHSRLAGFYPTICKSGGEPIYELNKLGYRSIYKHFKKKDISYFYILLEHKVREMVGHMDWCVNTGEIIYKDGDCYIAVEKECGSPIFISFMNNYFNLYVKNCQFPRLNMFNYEKIFKNYKFINEVVLEVISNSNYVDLVDSLNALINDMLGNERLRMVSRKEVKGLLCARYNCVERDIQLYLDTCKDRRDYTKLIYSYSGNVRRAKKRFHTMNGGCSHLMDSSAEYEILGIRKPGIFSDVRIWIEQMLYRKMELEDIRFLLNYFMKITAKDTDNYDILLFISSLIDDNSNEALVRFYKSVRRRRSSMFLRFITEYVLSMFNLKTGEKRKNIPIQTQCQSETLIFFFGQSFRIGLNRSENGYKNFIRLLLRNRKFEEIDKFLVKYSIFNPELMYNAAYLRMIDGIRTTENRIIKFLSFYISVENLLYDLVLVYRSGCKRIFLKLLKIYLELRTSPMVRSSRSRRNRMDLKTKSLRSTSSSSGNSQLKYDSVYNNERLEALNLFLQKKVNRFILMRAKKILSKEKSAKIFSKIKVLDDMLIRDK
jgi:hypothetical protein